MDVSDLLRQAWGAVESAEIPESLQPKAFEAAVQILACRVSDPRTSPDSGRGRGAGSAASNREDHQSEDVDAKPETPRASGSLLEKLSHESGIDVGDLEEVLFFDGEGIPHVTGPARKLGRSMSEQARNVALLITATRALALDESNIGSKVIRDEFPPLKRFDQNISANTHCIHAEPCCESVTARAVRLS